MKQEAPDPVELRDLVEKTRFRPSWQVRLIDDYDRGQGCRGMTLSIVAITTNSYPPYEPTGINHLFIVPAAAYDRRSWRRWLFEQCALVTRHEDAEFFEIDGVKVYAPSHGPGNDPYMLREVGTDEDVRTSFRGEINE